MRRHLVITGWTMIWTGLFLLGYVGYQLYGTSFFTERAQAAASVDLEQSLAARRAALVTTTIPTTTLPAFTSTTTPPASSGTTLLPARPDPVRIEEPAVPEGEPFARLFIPSIDVERVVFEGVTRDTLRLGPGHMPWTPLPGQPGNAVISGHRTTNGAPFYDLDALREGDLIQVETAIGMHTYEVREQIVVTPVDVWVTEERRGAWLTLTTCTPRYSARQRLIIFAELVQGPNVEYARWQAEQSLGGLS